MVEHILVAVDGSEGSTHAAKFALDLARQTGARLTLLTALELPVAVPVGPFDGFFTVGEPPSPEKLAEAEKTLDRLAHGLPRDRFHSRVEIGNAPDAICRLAEELKVDLVVVGARGLSAASRWLLGSVSDKVLRHCSRPVTVVR